MARKRVAAEGSMGVEDLALGVLTLPILGAPRLVHWIAGKILEEVEREEFDEEKLHGQLLDLQMRHELGEIGDAEHSGEEAALLDRLNYIRQRKEQD